VDFEIRPFDLIGASSGDWVRLGEFIEIMNNEFWPEEPQFGIDRWRTMLENELEERDIVAYEAVDPLQGERMVAFVRLQFWRDHSPSFKGNEHICLMNGPTVRSEYRRKSLATKLLPFIYDEVGKAGRTSIVGPILNEAGHILLQKIGGDEAQRVQDNRLALDNVDWNMVDDWVDEGPKRSPNTRIEFFRSIPDNIIEQYCDVYTEVMNQAPRDELKVGDMILTPESWNIRMEKFTEAGMKYLVAITKETNGDISGLTDVAWFPSRPSVLEQWLTGVQMKYRGRGLGKWIKGAILLRVRDEFPGVTSISTQNATSNEPMLDINRRLGFKLYRETYNYQLEVTQLKKYLDKH